MGALVLILAIACIIASLVMAAVCSGRVLALGPLLLYVVGSVLFINIGYIIYFISYSTYQWAVDALFSVSLGLLAVASGGFIGGLIFQTPTSWARMNQERVTTDIPFPIAVSTAVVVFVIVLLYFYFLGYIPLFEGIRTFYIRGFVPGLTNSFRVGRDVYVNSEASYIPLQGFMEAMRYFGLPLVVIWFLHYFKRGVRRKLSIAMISFAIVLTISTGQRWPLMYMILSVIIYWSWTEARPERFRRFLTKMLVAALAAGILLSALLGRTARNSLSWFQMLAFGVWDLTTRIFTGNVRIPFLSYQLFATEARWLYGWSWIQNLLSYLPGPYPSYPVTFYQVVTKDPRGFTAPPDFYTEAFINFGWFGVIAIPFFWGITLAFFQRLIVRPNPGLLRTSVAIALAMLVSFSSMSGAIFILGGAIVYTFLVVIIKLQITLLHSHNSFRENCKRS